MQRSVRLGLAAVVLYLLSCGLAFVPNGTLWEPLGFVSIFLSGVLGLMAARNGTKWWLVVPGVVVATVTVTLILASMAY